MTAAYLSAREFGRRTHVHEATVACFLRSCRAAKSAGVATR